MPQEEFLRKILRIYPWFFLLIIFVFIIANGIYATYTPLFLEEPGKTIYIRPKTSLKSVADLLHQQGVIRSSFYFRVYLFLTNQTKKIKAGYYTFQGKLNLPEVAEILVKGGRGVKMTFPEGLTLREIQDLLSRNLKRQKFNLTQYRLKDFPNLDLIRYFPEDAGLEGFLFPDTYEFFPDEDEKTITLRFLKNFSDKALPLFLKQPGMNFYEKLIIASLLEREVKGPDEMRLVAGIIEKRLKTKKPLEIDAASVYEQCKQYPCDWQVTNKQLALDSPYNTYKRIGLPPTPINNPGTQAIISALNPQLSDYWFYLTTSEGKAVFSKTFKEHQKMVRKYLKR
jgi:UPF0755 protein